MKKIIYSLLLSLICIFSANAQDKGDWYVGAGDIGNTAWTDWSVNPTIGYGITNKMMVGFNVSQEDSTAERVIDVHARYYMKNFFVYASTTGLDTDNMSYGIGKMFTFHNNVYIDPKLVYNTGEKTTNLMLGVGLKF